MTMFFVLQKVLIKNETWATKLLEMLNVGLNEK